jgi:uncharacterized protein (DUF169 family)
MDQEIKNTFIVQWKKYFCNAELPVVFYYTGIKGNAGLVKKPETKTCFICQLAKVRKGITMIFNADSLTCGGAKRYLGYTDSLMTGFEYFLSCGKGPVRGERYLHRPEQVKELMKNMITIAAEDRNIVFKRWDKLNETDEPDVVIFFAKPDVLSGLFTLANFDQSEPNGTFTPFSSGCGSIVYYPYIESRSDRQRAVIGMFDPSARPCLPEDILTFAIPMKRFLNMIGYMNESFLITDSWNTIRKRIEKSEKNKNQYQ